MRPQQQMNWREERESPFLSGGGDWQSESLIALKMLKELRHPQASALVVTLTARRCILGLHT